MTFSAEAWFLAVWIFVSGAWVSGDTMDGWGAMRQDSLTVCQPKADRANAINDPDKFKFICDRRQT